MNPHNLTISEEVTSLGSKIFSSSNALLESTRKSNVHGIVEEIIVYKWPANVSNDSRLKLLTLFTVCGKSSDISHSKWQSWVISFSTLCFSELELKIKAEGSREIVFKTLANDTIQTGLALFSAMSNAEDEEDAALAASRKAFVLPERFPDVDPTSEFFHTDLLFCETIPAIYGFNSLLLFMAGKKMNDINSRAVAEARPTAIINTYKAEAAAYILTGDGKIDPKNYVWVNLCWTKSQAAKKAIFTEVAAFAKSATQAQAVTYTTAKLLEFVGMQPAFYIHKFLISNPWCSNISIVRPAIAKYHDSLKEIARVPAYLQPYYKVIYGESTKAFHRQALLPLTACAIAYDRITNPTLANYALGEGADSAVNAFDAEARQKGFTTQLGGKQDQDDEE